VLASVRPDLVVEVASDRHTREGIWEQLAPFRYNAYAIVDVGLRPIPTLEAFRTAGPGDAHIDAVFTADRELGQQLEMRLNRR
jgi:hypothetical protein